jgi:hypothetical protein
MLNVRLSEEEEKALERYCQESGISKSSVVKEALALYMKEMRRSKTSFEFGEDLFGKEGSGSSDRSVTYKEQLKKKLDAKHTR